MKRGRDPRRKATRWVAASLFVFVLIPALPANAQTEIVTLHASTDRVVFGRGVALHGRVRDPAAGSTVEIVNEAGFVVTTATADEEGRFRVRFWPRRNVTLRAEWLDQASEAVTLRVKPLLAVEITKARLFDRVRVRGRLQPIHEGQRIAVTLLRNGRAIARRSPGLGASPRFTTSFPVNKPGRYRAKVRFNDPDHLPAHAGSASTAAVLPPALSIGARSLHVKLLERRLIALGYYLPRADRVYDHKTSDAVIAFNKVQRHSRTGSVSVSTWRTLVDPIRPRPGMRSGRFHIEVDQTRQVILVVRRGTVEHILHTSTGAGGATRDGRFQVTRKLGGTSGGGLYYPSYFDGLRAIHGWREVPTYPASHGCARVPMWAAQWIYSLAEIGTRVIVYH